VRLLLALKKPIQGERAIGAEGRPAGEDMPGASRRGSFVDRSSARTRGSPEFGVSPEGTRAGLLLSRLHQQS
jgi:hypothetical protein